MFFLSFSSVLCHTFKQALQHPAGYDKETSSRKGGKGHLAPHALASWPVRAVRMINWLILYDGSGDRLSQMTKTYHDVEAVTRLLEEKEKDLELAAKIGQELLERNKGETSV